MSRDRRLGRGRTTKDISSIRVLANLGGAVGTATDHGSLSGLADDDHTQYAHLSQSETILGQWSFAPASAQAPFLVGANAQGVLTGGLNADEVDGYHGSELAVLAENETITGAWVHENDLRIKDTYNLEFGTSGPIYLGRYSDTEIGIHGGFRSISPNYQIESAGWNITYDGNAEFRRMFADELHIRAFIADIEQALAGGQIIAKSVAILERDFTAPTSINGTAYIYVEDLPGFFGVQAFASGDYVRLRYVDRSAGGLVIDDVWGSVTSYVDQGDGYQRWTFTLRDGPITGVVIHRGAIVVDYGTSGQGYWEVTTLNPQYSPYARVVTWTTNPWTSANHTVRSVMGKLDGITDPQMAPTGWGFYSDNAYLNGDLVAVDGDVIIDSDGMRFFTPTSVVDKNSIRWQIDDSPVIKTQLTGWYGSSTTMIAQLDAINYNTSGVASVYLDAWSNPGASPTETGIHASQAQSGVASMAFTVNGSPWLWMRTADGYIKSYKSIYPDTGDQDDLGSPSFYWNHIYVRNIHADTIEGTTIGGQTWSSSTQTMYIKPVYAGGSTVYIVNDDASYTADLNVEGNIIVGGNVDGVDVSAHAANVNAHHNRSHGLTSSSDHTATGNALDILGLTAANTIGLLVPSSAPTDSKILKSTATGALQLTQLGVSIAAATERAINIQHISSSTTTAYGIYSRVYERTATADAYGVFGNVVADQDVALGALTGVLARAQIQMSGAVTTTNLVGLNAHAYHASAAGTVTNSYAIWANNEHYGAGPLTYQYGVYSQLSKDAGAPAASVAYAFRSYMPAGIATTKYAFHSNLGTVFLNSDGNADSDFRVDGDTLAGVLFVDATNDNVGIGTTAPSSTHRLHVSGDTKLDGNVGISTNASTTARLNIQWINTSLASTLYGVNIAMYNRYNHPDAQVTSFGIYALADTAVSGGWLRGGYFQAQGNSTGGSSTDIASLTTLAKMAGTHNATSLVGLQPQVHMTGTGTLSWAAGIDLTFYKSSTTTPTNAYGIKIGDVAVGTNNYAILTNLGKVVFNDGSGDADVQIKGDNDQYLFYSDGSADKVGIGTNTPGTKLHILHTTSPQFRISYDGSNYADFYVSSGGELKLYPSGNLVLDPQGNDVLPQSNYDINIGMMSKKFKALYASELIVETLVAQNTIATIGGRILVGPTTTLTTDFLSTAGPSISNDSFETAGGGGSDVFANWAEVIPTGASIARSSAQAKSGTYSALLTTGSYDVDICSVESDAIAVTASSKLSVNMWSYGDGSNAASVAILDKTNSATITTALLDGKDSWARNSVPFTVPSNCTSIAIKIISPAVGSGYVYVDLMSLFYSEIAVKHNEMAVGDTAYMEANGQVEFFKITSGPSGAGPYTYRVDRDIEESGIIHNWYAGDAMFNTGTTGDGFIDLYSVSSIKGGTQYGPTIVGNVRNSGAFNDWTEHWAIGNLNGLYGKTNTYGVGLGKYSGNHVVITPTSGIEFMSATTRMAQLTSTTWTLGSTAADHVEISSSAVKMKDSSVVKIDLQTDGDLFLGSNVSAAATTYLSIFAEAQTYNSESMGAGDMLIGDNSANKANILWDYSAGQLLFRGGTTTNAYIDTDGILKAGQGAVLIGSSGLAIDISSSWEERRSLSFKSSSTAKYQLRGWMNGTEARLDIYDTGSANNSILTLSGYSSNGGYTKQVNLECTSGADQVYTRLQSYESGGGVSQISMGAPDFISMDTPFLEISGGLAIGSLSRTPETGVLSIAEIASGPAAPGNGAEAKIYVKDNKLIVYWYDGTHKYRYMDLSLTANPAVWTYTTTAP